MNIRETRQDGFLVVAPAGRLDSNTVRAFDRALVSATQRGETRVVLDFAELDYIGSMGLSVLLAMAKRIKAAKGEMLIRSMNDRVRLVFEMSGLLRLFDIR